MRLPASIMTSALLQTAFVACAVLGSWQSDAGLSLEHIAEDAPRHVALHVPAPIIRIAPPVLDEPAPEPEEPLATTTVEEQRKPQTPPARVVKKTPPKKRVVKDTPKPAREPEQTEPPEQPKLKTLVAVADDKAPSTPAVLAENRAPAAPLEHAQIAPAAPAAAIITTTTSTPSPITAPAHAGQKSNVDRAGALKAYKRLLFSTIDRKKSVPRAARRARLEGTVYLSVTLDHTGKILSVKVRKSSGHATLDEGAVSTMKSLKKLPAPPEALGWSKKTLTIPIRYKIK